MAAKGSSAWRQQVWGKSCAPRLKRVAMGSAGANPGVEERAYEAFQALSAVFVKHGYPVRAADTGAYNCRKITGGTSASAHSWAIAMDVNWNTNPYRKDRLVTDMPPKMVADAVAIRTKGGVQVFRWGGDWDGRPNTPHSNYDAMHWEIVATPDELRQGIDWDTVRKPAVKTKEPAKRVVLRRDDRGPSVVELQKALKAAGYDVGRPDGVFGRRTLAAVRRFQKERKLKVDGVVGAGTWTALLTRQPKVSGRDPSPVKLKS